MSDLTDQLALILDRLEGALERASRAEDRAEQAELAFRRLSRALAGGAALIDADAEPHATAIIRGVLQAARVAL